MIRRKLALLIVATSITLTGCSNVMDVFGPRPNSELVTLAQQAEADAASLDDETQELRDFHAEQLYDEIVKLCGVDEQGNPPGSCEITSENEQTGAASAPESAEQLVGHVTENRDSLPDASVDLVVAQAIDLVAATNIEVPSPDALTEPLPEADATQAAEVLEAEFALQYGLGLASAYADDALQERIDELMSTSEDRVAVLEAALGEAAPDPAVGYELQAGDEPSTTEEAGALVDTLASELNAKWRIVAARAESTEWLEKAINLAASTQ